VAADCTAPATFRDGGREVCIGLKAIHPIRPLRVQPSTAESCRPFAMGGGWHVDTGVTIAGACLLVVSLIIFFWTMYNFRQQRRSAPKPHDRAQADAAFGPSRCRS